MCLFSGWLRELYGPGFLELLAPQLLSRKVWVFHVHGPYSQYSNLFLEFHFLLSCLFILYLCCHSPFLNIILLYDYKKVLLILCSWVVVLPCGSRNLKKPFKLELAIYASAQVLLCLSSFEAQMKLF